MKFLADEKVLKENLMDLVESKSLRFLGLKPDLAKTVVCQYAEACIDKDFITLGDAVDLCAALRTVVRTTDCKIESSIEVASFLRDFIDRYSDIIQEKTSGCVDIW